MSGALPNLKKFPDNKSEWYSWIPTNVGYLNFNYIADEKNLASVFGTDEFLLSSDAQHSIKSIKLNNTNLSDINSLVQDIYKIEEIFAKADITFINNKINNQALNRKQPSNITGNCKIFYDNLLEINSEFDIQTNGKIKIDDIQLRYNDKINLDDFENNNVLLNTIVNALYTLIKKIVHGDNHHFQKIDTLIGVYTQFIPEQILTDLGFQIKRLDKFVKNNDEDSIAVLYNVDKQNAYNVALGFMSYISTFYNIFIRDNSPSSQERSSGINYIKYKNIKNTLKSIYAGVNKFNEIENAKKGKLVFIVSLLALFAALNIFFSTIVDDGTNYSDVGTFLLTLLPRDVIILAVFILIFLATFKKFIKNYVNRKFRESMISSGKLYTFFELVVFYKYANERTISSEVLEQNGNHEKIKNLGLYFREIQTSLVYIGVMPILMAFFIGILDFFKLNIIAIIVFFPFILFWFYKISQLRKKVKL